MHKESDHLTWIVLLRRFLLRSHFFDNRWVYSTRIAIAFRDLKVRNMLQ